MVRSVFGKVMWVGRATVFLVGLAVILALVIGLASAALAGTGVGATFNLGQTNTVDRVSTLVNNGVGPALNLRVGPSNTTPANNTVMPMKVNSQKKVTNFNADELDGMNASVLAPPRGYARVEIDGDIDPAHSKGVIDVVKPNVGNDTNPNNDDVYCFQLDFTPHAAVGSPHVTNAADVATALQPNNEVDSKCDPPHNDAVVQTFGSDGGDAPVNFHIVFI